MSSPQTFYSNNHTEYTGGSGTPATGPVPPSGPFYIARVVVTSTLTGNLTLTDTKTGGVLLNATTPAAGTIYELRVRSGGAVTVAPGSGGTISLYWD